MAPQSQPIFSGAQELHHDFLTDGLLFGESPRYRDGKLYLSDMTGKKIYVIDTSTGDKQVLLEVEHQPNGMCFAADGSLIYSSMFDAKLHRLQLENNKSELYADLSGLMTGYCGDMVIDQHGRVFIDDTGARVLHGETPRAGRLLVVETDGTVKSAAEDVVFPNGIAIDNEGKSLFLVETFKQRLNKFGLGPNSELRSRTEVWTPAELAAQQGDTSNGIFSIDGCCMDAEDGLWLSMLAYDRFIRLDAAGRITHQINVDGHATACTLGGDDGKTLFLVTNKVPEEEDLFSAMVGKRTRCTVSTARVNIGRGRALP